MHYARAFVRPASRRALQTLEAQTGGPHMVELQDVCGATALVELLNPAYFAKEVEVLPRAEALQAVQRMADRLSRMGCGSSGSVTETIAPPGSSLYVKETAPRVRAELLRRQSRFLAKLEGRLLACDFDAVGRLVRSLLANAGAADIGPVTDEDMARYRGIVEELSHRDAEAALAVAVNDSLPPLSAGPNSALAKMVDLSTLAAVHAFLDAFAPRDVLVPASEAAATQLAIRLRQARAGEQGDGVDGAPRALMEAAIDEGLHACLAAPSVDAGAVFPADPGAIQRWAARLLPADLLPWQQSEQLLRHVTRHHLLPRRVCVDALSVWCLSDLEREWVRAACFGYAMEDSRTTAGGARGEERQQPLRRPLHPAVSASFQKQAQALILKDARRGLVSNRLLREYAALLEEGHMAPTDPSFAAFVEECGECHGTGTYRDCPPHIRFAMAAPPPGVPLVEALRSLAPTCALWSTLLSTAGRSRAVTARVAPCGDVLVDVALPGKHECMSAAEDLAKVAALPAIPVLYEDESVIVVDKPSGLATSRHCLSCTQLGEPVTDLVSVLQCGGGVTGATLARVPRQGQVHRLDRETSGCVVFAKTAAAADSLRHQMGTAASFAHDGKLYLALCVVLEPQLNRLPLRGQLVDPADPKVRTSYRIAQFFRRSRIALVECRIQQGKKHQIRRHLAAAGLPVLGDVNHGGAACSSPLMDRVALHARHLSFIHPVTAEVLTVSSPMPADFHRALQLLTRKA